MEPDDEPTRPSPPRPGVWAPMAADPAVPEDLRALRQRGTICVVLLVPLVLIVLAYG